MHSIIWTFSEAGVTGCGCGNLPYLSLQGVAGRKKACCIVDEKIGIFGPGMKYAVLCCKRRGAK